ncbi:MAG: hypothetical protein L6R42_001042, partial [Xanthoria sp. 1 TBL-2021]
SRRANRSPVVNGRLETNLDGGAAPSKLRLAGKAPSSRRSEGEPQSGLKRLSPSSSFLRAEGGASKNTETKRPAVFSGGSGWLEHKTCCGLYTARVNYSRVNT